MLRFQVVLQAHDGSFSTYETFGTFEAALLGVELAREIPALASSWRIGVRSVVA